MTVLNFNPLQSQAALLFSGNVVIYDGPNAMSMIDNLNLCFVKLSHLRPQGNSRPNVTLRWSGNDSSHWDQVCRESGNLGWWFRAGKRFTKQKRLKGLSWNGHFTQQMEIQKLGVLKYVKIPSKHSYCWFETLHSIDMIRSSIQYPINQRQSIPAG